MSQTEHREVLASISVSRYRADGSSRVAPDSSRVGGGGGVALLSPGRLVTMENGHAIRVLSPGVIA